MQSLNITSARRSPAINARVLSSKQPTASTAFSPSKPRQVNRSLDLQSVAKELTDSSDARNKQPTIEVLKPSACTGSSTYSKETALLANQVLTGLQARVAPVPIEGCTGGVYYLRTKNRRLTGVFKPADEEAYAPNNPKDFHKPEKSSGISGMRKGISAGDAAVREVAAYLLDHQHFARVPVTMLASVYHPDFYFQASGTPHCKTGALQAYVAHRDTADDIGTGMFNVADVQAIAILDIRLANQDRHGGNMLVIEPAQVVTQTSTAVVTKSIAGKKVSLIPIDHGACLPRISALSETAFMWLLWPQAKQPFSTAAREYIRALDADSDLKLLENNLPADYQLEREAMLTLHVCTALLKFCALDRQMTAYDIGMIMCRQGTIAQQETIPSVLETLVASSLRDSAVLKNEAMLKLQEKHQPVQKMANLSLVEKSPSPDKAWTSYVTTFMTVFHRELMAHLATK
ncbi:Phosphatidylinositol 3 and 4-Kinase-like protein [Phytophthora palmivora]|uniref:Phosphatidylinositol 3 and 4-Kinase-like protein n=1 Tax=Phytophthora palmivora TaxID=4796 RepID=A0A2P4X3P2_9STRA|nr:Phosphatidylinositol 3 and 4-Kinase-like protein [Phytophthora palmivora]